MTIPVGYGQASVIYSGSGVPRGAANVFGVANTTGLSAVAVANAVLTVWNAEVMPVLIQNVGVEEVRVKLGPDDTGPMATSGAGASGADTSAQAPPNVAYLVTKNTSLGGRRGRGRIFVPGVDETQVLQNGTIDGTFLGTIQTAMDDMLQGLENAAVPMVVLHEPATEWQLVNGQPRRVPIAGAIPVPTVVTSLTVAGTVATQRRRLRA